MNKGARRARISFSDLLSPLRVILWIHHFYSKILLRISKLISWCLEILKESYAILELFTAVPSVSQLIDRGLARIWSLRPRVTDVSIGLLELAHPVELPLQDSYDFFVQFGVETKEHRVFIPCWRGFMIL